MSSADNSSITDCLKHHFHSHASADKAKMILDMLPATFNEICQGMDMLTEHAIRQKLSVLKDAGYVETEFKDYETPHYTFSYRGIKEYLSKWRERFYNQYARP